MSERRLAREQPAAFAFTAKNKRWAKTVIGRYPKGCEASAVVPLLWRAQKQAGGWLPEPAIRHVADIIHMPYIRALEIATFYTMFNLAPRGKYLVQLCGTVPCHLLGAQKLKEVCTRLIGSPKSVSEDGQLSWREVECLGACVNAPVVQINDRYHENLQPPAFEKLLNSLRNA